MHLPPRFDFFISGALVAKQEKLVKLRYLIVT
jgi:hypothetical protein